MKILWFTNTPSLYKAQSKGYNGGGWISSLENLIKDEDSVDLCVCFFDKDKQNLFKINRGKTTYYPISLYNDFSKIVKHNLFYNKFDSVEIECFMKVIDDCNPDVIHVFGTENSFGLIKKYTSIPVIIHIQGLLNPTLNALFAPGNSYLSQIFSLVINPIKLLNFIRNNIYFKHNVKRESDILKNCEFFMGRTNWDFEISRLYASSSKYFYCSEVLRDDFYTAMPWKRRNESKIIIISTVSKISYKGFDLILKTSKLLKELDILDFEWKVFGLSEYREWENCLKIISSDVNVSLNGIVSPKTIIDCIQNADVFIHPSYIDNSPNSICEAQIVGIPVISTNVGGISSLIEDGKSGFLVPANDPYTLASKIIYIYNNTHEATRIGAVGRKTALVRHNKNTIKNNLLNIYQQITHAKNTNILF